MKTFKEYREYMGSSYRGCAHNYSDRQFYFVNLVVYAFKLLKHKHIISANVYDEIVEKLY